MKHGFTAGQCSNVLLDLNSLPPQEDSIIENRTHPIETFSQLPKYVDGGSLDFHIEASSVECISLIESFLYLRLKVVKFNKKNEEQPIGKDDLVSYSPFVGNTLFKAISMKINDEEISQTAENYHSYEAYLNAVLHLTRNGQRSLLDGSGLSLSRPGSNSWTDPRPNSEGVSVNPGLTERHNLAEDNESTGFVTPLIWAPFLVPRVLPTKTEIDISLKLNSSEFCLIAFQPTTKNVQDQKTKKFKQEKITAGSLPTYRIKIEKAELCLQKYRLSPSAQLRQERMLSSGAVYPMTINKTTSFVLEKGSSQGFRALTIASELPRMCYVFMTTRTSLNSIKESPFDFKQFDVSEMYMVADGTKYPSNLSYNPQFKKGHYIRDWRIFQKEMHYANPDLFFNSSDWAASGYTIFPFNIVPDRSIGCSEYISTPENKSGNLNLHLKFEKELDEAIVIFVMMEYYRVLRLDSSRKPSWV